MRFAELSAVVCCCAVISATFTHGGASPSPYIRQLESHGHDKRPLPYYAPPYSQSLELVKQCTKNLRGLLPYDDLQVIDPRRHYVVIAGVLGSVVEYLNSDCSEFHFLCSRRPPDYEHEYLPAVDRLLPVVWQDSKLTVSKAEQFLTTLESYLKPIQELMNYFCKDQEQELCDLILLAIAQSKAEYFQALQVLIDAGELAALFEAEQFWEVAKNYNEVAYLIKGKEKLKPLVLKATTVVNKLYGKKCQH